MVRCIVSPALELCYLSAAELARRIRAGELSPGEAVRASLERIEQVDPVLNCFVDCYPDEAIVEARAAQRALAAGEPVGPLHGVPVAFKDLTPMLGRRTTQGSYSSEHWVPERSALAVERVIAAGAIVVGKTTTPEFAHTGVTESPLLGITRNPWDPERTPGGSSGGSAAAVATGCVPIAEGTDMGGSIRIPAGLSGVVGLKPSYGRIPLDFVPLMYDTIHHIGPLARTVEDARLFLEVAQGPDDRDIMSLPPLELPPLDASADGLRLALDVDLGFFAVDPECERVVREAADALAAAGAEVEEVDLGWTRELVDAWRTHWCVYLAGSFGSALDGFREQMDPRLVAMMDEAAELGAIEHERLQLVWAEAWRKLAAVHEQFDALLCPTNSLPAQPIGTDYLALAADTSDGRYHGVTMTSAFNCMSQCPVLSVPAGWTDGGLPVGLQIVGRRYRDDVALRVGAALEQARPWAERHPASVA